MALRGNIERHWRAAPRLSFEMNSFIIAFCVGLASGDLIAQTNAWQPSPGHTQVPIWPGPMPDPQPVKGPEMATVLTNKLVAGKPWTWVENVSRPTLTVYGPKGTNTGVAVVVFPGGGYYGLAIDLEGTEVCDWLTSRGMTGVLLKYRVPDSGPHGLVEPKAPTALEDAQRTLGLLRMRASEWHIDSHKIGVLGFSAGGHLVAAISTHFDRRLYPAVDAADKASCRPDFAIALYPGHLCKNGGDFDLNPNVPVTSHTPSTFLLQAEDDPVDPVMNSLVYYIALKKAGVTVEMHLYAQGGHGFGLRRTKFPITGWPRLVETWLRTIRMTSE
jgi:acetyl esterase/lipase